MRADCHMHTYFSGDSEAKPEDMVLAAIDKGLEAICFTDHEDIDYFCDDIEFVFDPETYFKELGALKEKYKEKLDIRIGVEVRTELSTLRRRQKHLPWQIRMIL